MLKKLFVEAIPSLANDKVLYVGLALVGMGVVAGYLASFNIKEISNSSDQTP